MLQRSLELKVFEPNDLLYFGSEVRAVGITSVSLGALLGALQLAGLLVRTDGSKVWRARLVLWVPANAMIAALLEVSVLVVHWLLFGRTSVLTGTVRLTRLAEFGMAGAGYGAITGVLLLWLAPPSDVPGGEARAILTAAGR